MQNKNMLKYIISNLEKARYELVTTNKLVPNTVSQDIIDKLDETIRNLRKEFKNKE